MDRKYFKIITDENHILDNHLTYLYIIYKLKEDFQTLKEFHECEEILHPSYWGDSISNFTIKEYHIWITNLANITL